MSFTKHQMKYSVQRAADEAVEFVEGGSQAWAFVDKGRGPGRGGNCIWVECDTQAVALDTRGGARKGRKQRNSITK